MIGTIRALDSEMQNKGHERIRLTATKIAESAGATAEVEIIKGYPVTYNHVGLTAKMLPTLQEAAGSENVALLNATMGAEDFSFFANEAPGLFIRLGGRPKDVSEENAAPHHTPDFFIDDSGLNVGVKALCYLALDFMADPKIEEGEE